MSAGDFRQDRYPPASYSQQVSEAESYRGASAALHTRRPELVARWMAGYQSSRLRLPRELNIEELAGSADGLCEALEAGLAEPGTAPGHGSMREAEKRFAFVGGSFGMAGASAFDLSAFVLTLRDALSEQAASPEERAALVELFDWFCALALEGYATSREDALRLRHRDELERGTPLVMLTPELPVVLLVGEPDRAVLESVFGRLLLSVVRVGAKAVIIDGGGLVRAGDERVLDALSTFTHHRKVVGAVQVVLCNLPPDAEAAWREAASDPAEPRMRVDVIERFEDAVSTALAAYGLKVGKR
jgi:hypothetical protein